VDTITRSFPLKILETYRKFVLVDENDEDHKISKNNFQYFTSKYLSKHKSLLLYHATGTGKSSKTIYFLNAIYTASPNTNIYVIIKAGLRNNWLGELKKWANSAFVDKLINKVNFIHFDSQYAYNDYEEKRKMTDESYKSIYIIDEVHLFISRVISNMNDTPKSSLLLYNSIINDKRENNATILALSATPMINEPFEVAILFNLLRPGIFPNNREEFNELFIDPNDKSKMKLSNINMFQRRIIGLVSYYAPVSIPGEYATKKEYVVNVEMSMYQTEKYNQIVGDNNKKQTTQFKSSERQRSNFVIPYVNGEINANNRPTEHNLKLSAREFESVSTKFNNNTDAMYRFVLNHFTDSIEKYFDAINKDDVRNEWTIKDDIKLFDKYPNYRAYAKKEKRKSRLLTELYKNSAKYIYSIFLLTKNPGVAIVYSEFVILEGLSMYKIYLKYFNYKPYKTADDNYGYAGFTGLETSVEKEEIQKINHDSKYLHGEKIKIIFFSGAGVEGISVKNVRQIHVMESYWNYAKIEQLIGRGIRFHSHINLDMKERHVDVFKFNSMKNQYKYTIVDEKQVKIKETDPIKLETVNHMMMYISENKFNIINEFNKYIKEIAVDCALNAYANHQTKCFNFSDNSVFNKTIKSAYNTNILKDQNLNNGTNNLKSIEKHEKMYKILAHNSKNYWYNPNTGHIYDYKLKFMQGQVLYNSDNSPIQEIINGKLTYKISEMLLS